MPTSKEVFDLLKGSLPFRPTTGQEGFIYQLSEFLTEPDQGGVFLLRGYAGTGKTSMVIGLVKTLAAMNRKYALLAPTGRAAKVLAGYTGKRAFTIHKFIYQIVADAMGTIRFVLRHNRGKRAVIIVDEASMISVSQVTDSGRIQSRNLLSDLMEFLDDGKDCKLILIGDTAQLPPVGATDSPALDPRLLQRNFNFDSTMQFELRDVVRQDADSGILENATRLRQMLHDKQPSISINTDSEDITVVDPYDMEDTLNSAYARFGEDGVMIITRSNKTANQYNQQVRLRIRFMEDEVAAGDRLMVVKNNYFWLPKKHPAGFIANGDLMEVMRMTDTEERYGFRFADATVRLLDYPESETFDVKLLLNTLHVDSASLPDEDAEQLFLAVSSNYAHITVPSERAQKLAEDPYLNAVQVKFGYAITCHKAQGGQWPAVFVDQGYITPEMLGTEYIRWLYTAVTRASEHLFLMNFHEEFLHAS